MMQKIKYALAFLAGCFYASFWWLCVVFDDPQLILLPVLSTIGLLMLTAFTIAIHWND